MPKQHPTIIVTVVTGRGEKSYEFRQETKVSEVISQVIGDFGFSPSDRYILTRKKSGEELKPERPLVSYGIEDGELLVLTAVGSGV